MRISDWSSDVCSSDLFGKAGDGGDGTGKLRLERGCSVIGQFLAQPPICAKRADRRKAAAAQAIRHQRGGHAKPHGALAIKRSVDIENHQPDGRPVDRSEEHTSELQSLMRISYAVFCL